MAFWWWVEKEGWGVSKPNRAASHTARLRSGQEAGVGAGPESQSWKRVAVRGGVIEKALGRGEVMLGGVRLVGGELADCGEDG